MLAVISGVGLGLVQAPWSVPFAFLFLSVIFWLHAGATTRRQAALLGWIFGLGYFALTLGWIVEPFLIDIARHGWMAPFALLFMAGGLAAFWALAFWIAPRGRVFMLVLLWTLVEIARAYVFTGFPWALVAQGWLETPMIQLVSLVGVHGLGFITLTSLALVSRLKPKPVLLGIAILAATWSFGAFRLSQPETLRADGYVVRVVQPNVDQAQKWLPEFQQTFFQRHLDLSASVGAPDIIIWPEAAVPFLPETRPDLMRDISDVTQGAEVILGARRRDENGNWYNRLVLLGNAGNILDSYDKHHLVPFGEYVPLKGILERLGLSALTGTGWTAGQGPRVISQGDTPPFLPLICYEAIFPQHANADGARADWIVQITNDAWFGQFSGPYQHLAQARIRAIEQGLPLVRSANTGVSAVVDPHGRVVSEIPLWQMGFIDVALPKALPVTIYSRLGDWPVAGLLLLLTVWQLIWYRRRVA